MRQRTILWTVLLCAVLMSPLHAQNAAVKGNVTNAMTGEVLPGVHIRLLNPNDNSFVSGAYTDMNGDFHINGLSPGSYQLVTTFLGCKTDARTVDLAASGVADIGIALEEEMLDMGEVVVTASRRKEKALDAPASVAIVSSRDIQARNAVSTMEHIEGVQGVDIAQKGVMQHEYVARGLNNVFNGTMRTLVDNRLTNLPSLRANISYLQSLSDADIDRVEVVLGPGSALYGPNVTNGVVNIITKSPFASRGTDVAVTGGEQSLMALSARHAGTLGSDFGYRLSAGYTKAKDWEYTDPREPYPADRTAERYNVDARLDYLVGQNSSLTVNAGRSTAVSGLDLTDNGAVAAKDFSYSHVQTRFVSGDFFAQAYLNMNDAGDTYLLRANQPIVDNSKKIVAEVQHGASPADWEHLTYGVDMFLTRPETNGTIMGRNEDKDNVNEFGAYVQSDTKLLGDNLSLLLAGRIDYHSALENPVFSPRAGIRFSPAENHSMRITYNQAYLTPAISDLFLDMQITDDVFGMTVDPLMYGLRNAGVPETGYTFTRQNGDLVFYSKLNPDPTMGLPVGMASAYWDGVVQVLSASPELPDELKQLLAMIPAPDASQVGGSLAQLNLETEGFDLVDASSVNDIARLKPTSLQSWEIGYKSMLTDRLQFGVDMYNSQYENFVTPARVATPNVFLNGEQTAAYLYAQAAPIIGDEAAQQFAAAVAEGMAQVPIGTVTPDQAADRTEILMIPINYGDINYWGTDISFRAGLLRNLQIGGTYSYINKVYYDDVDGKGPLSLNVPQNKASLSMQYTEPSTGIQGMAQYRFIDGFRMKSGVYEGTIKPYGLVDLGVRVPLPVPMRPELQLSVRNLLDHQHVEFVGGGMIGRLMTARLQVRI
ncbi:MAG: TonB-dependent receptor [Bacteroidetes bacterium]|nr:TonB-dependent receptor [Bacteroidota bacterium]